MTSESSKQELLSISYRFYENLYSLRILSEQIGQMAEEYDQTAQGKFFSSLADLAGLSNGGIDTTGNTPFTLHVKHRVNPSEVIVVEAETKEGIDKTFDKDQDTENDQEDEISESTDKQNIIEVEIADKEQFVQILKLLKNARKYSQRQSRLLRQGALISLVSYFESLEADLLSFYYLKYPAALPSEGKMLSLADLREIGSVDEAEKVLIMKEIDAFLHEGTEGQIEYFTKRFKVDLKCTKPYLNSLVEVILRRNLVVHNNGIVNKVYLKRVDSEFVREKNIKEGDHLVIDGEYLTSAIDTICIFGTMMIQQSWRKWEEKKIESADDVLREYTYDLLVEKRWEVVNKLADYASTLNFLSDSNARIVRINQAIALKEQNKQAEMEALLDKQDWSSCAIKFHVANYTLREEYDKMIPLLTKAVATDEIDKQAIKEWPLFRWFRESTHYQAALEKLFPGLSGG
jgi:hypothetical protein